jgi:hypothetical protein
MFLFYIQFSLVRTRDCGDLFYYADRFNSRVSSRTRLRFNITEDPLHGLTMLFFLPFCNLVKYYKKMDSLFWKRKQLPDIGKIPTTGTAFIIFSERSKLLEMMELLKTSKEKRYLFCDGEIFLLFSFLLYLSDFTYEKKKYRLKITYGVEPHDVIFENLSVSNFRRFVYLALIIISLVVCDTYIYIFNIIYI